MKEGDKVRCIAEFTDGMCPRKPEIRPMEGRVYTIRRVESGFFGNHLSFMEIPEEQNGHTEMWDSSAFKTISVEEYMEAVGLPEKTKPKYLEWAELILETYCTK